MVDRKDEEVNPALESAVLGVARVYASGILAESVDTLDVEKQNTKWVEAAATNSQYAEQIDDLSESVRTSLAVRQRYGMIITAAVTAGIANVQDFGAQSLIRDLIIGRVAKPNGEFVSPDNVGDSANQIFQELGAKTQVAEARISLKEVVKGVLTGQVRFPKP